MATRPTTSDRFNDENYGGRPVRPVNDGKDGRRDPTRNVVLENRKTVGVVTKNPRQRLASNEPRYNQPTDEIFNAEYAKKGIQPLGIVDKISPKNTSSTEGFLPNSDHLPNQEQTYARPTTSGSSRLNLRKSKSVVEQTKDQIVANTLTRGVLTVGLSVWLVFQVPVAVLNIMFFGFAALFYGVAASDLGSALVSLVDVATRPAQYIYREATDILGIDISVDLFALPSAPFMITLALLMAFALIQFLVIYLLYTLASVKPFFGNTGGGLKIGMVILYFVGYFVPILNLFPWFIPWVLAVKRYPS